MFKRRQLTLKIFKNLLRAGIAVAIAAIIVFIASQQISKISNSIQQKKTLSYILEKRTETISALKNDFEAVGEADKRIETALPATDNILDFVATLESLAAETSVQQSLKFGNPVPAGLGSGNLNISTIDYNLTLTGNVLILINYLKKFETLPYFSGISSISIASRTDKGWEGDSTIGITAKLYTK